jgi:hypothetical protein
MRSTGDPVFDLVAAAYRQALADAKRGDSEAAAWLDMCCPGWREIIGRKPYPSRSRHKTKRAHVIKNAQNKPFFIP